MWLHVACDAQPAHTVWSAGTKSSLHTTAGSPRPRTAPSDSSGGRAGCSHGIELAEPLATV